ncbi:MAG TPA: SusC/RagA family TonB-linked outer membrane protein, partial [Flavisolibacter sp.]|nr:SusC/RagA family TonB-linked outer membrane protein [Flavisolibacter sp.]
MIFRVRKILTAFVFLTLTLASKGQPISLSFKSLALEEVFAQIESKTGYRFIFVREELRNSKPVTLEITSPKIETILDRIFEQQPLSYSINRNYISVHRKDERVTASSSITQNIDIKGRVSNEKGEGVAGATILVKGTGKATSSDDGGLFALSDVSPSAILVVTSVGYHRREFYLDGKTLVDISLSTAVSSLDETVVIAYGTTTRRSNTGNVSRVTEEQISTQPVNNPLLALSGHVPGLYIQQTTGVPGGGISVQIRGINSLRNSSADNGNLPLYIIDGVPYPAASLTSVYTSSSNLFGGNPLSSINPADIQSIEVLKDPDATAIYGSRGANGVILISTKKGKQGSTKVDARFYQGWGKVGHMIEMLSTNEFLKMRHLAKQNDAQAIFPYDYDINGTWDTTRYTNWQKQLVGGTAHFTDAQTSLSGGNANTQFLVGGGYHKESTVFPGDFGEQKGSFHLSLSNRSANGKFFTSFLGNYFVEDNRSLRTDLMRVALQLSPVAPKLFNADGTLNWENSTWDNPYAALRQIYKGKTTNLISNLGLQYELLRGLSLKTNLGYLNIQVKEKDKYPLSAQNPAYYAFGIFGASNFAEASNMTWIAEPGIEYQSNLAFGSIKILVGSSFQENLLQSQTLRGDGYTSDALLENLIAAPQIRVLASDYRKYRYSALFGRISYSYNEKYLVNLSGRRDGSSRFGSDKRFANFAAAGVGWIFSKEKRVKTALPFLSYGKLRASYGVTGSDQIADYGYLDTYSSTPFPYNGVSGLAPSRLGNPDYTWEKTTKAEAAVELGLFKDRLLLTVAYYQNLSSNQLIGYPLPGITGFNSIQFNLPAKVRNSGTEMELSFAAFNSPQFGWTSSFNITIPKNKLLAFPNIESSSFANRYVIGKSLFTQRLYHLTGVDRQTGVYVFEDVDKDGKISYPNDLQPTKEV